MAFGYAGVHQLVLPLLDCVEQLPGPQRDALDAVLGRAKHGALDPFLVGLAVLSLVAEAARVQPCPRRRSTTRSGSTTSRRWRCRSSDAGSAPNASRRSSPCATYAGTAASGSKAFAAIDGRRAVRPRGPRAADRGCGGTCRRVRRQPHRRRDGRQPAGARRTAHRVDGRAAARHGASAGPVADRRATLRPLRGAGTGAGRGRADGAAPRGGRADGRSDAAASRRRRGRRPVMGRGGREGRSERPGHVHPERRVPPSARSLGGLLLGGRRPIGAAPTPRSPRRSRRRRRRRPARLAPRRRRGRARTSRSHGRWRRRPSGRGSEAARPPPRSTCGAPPS